MHHAVFTQTFNGCHRAAVCLHSKHCATFDRFTVKMHGACTATRCVATNVGASELQLVTQKMCEQGTWLNISFLPSSIDGDADLHVVSFYVVFYVAYF
jgi:hypothetical protein